MRPALHCGSAAAERTDSVPIALFEADNTALVLVLTAEGEDAFCAGADLNDGAGLSARLHEPGGTIGFTRFTSPKPTIAAISGWCLGAGMDLAVRTTCASPPPMRHSASSSAAEACPPSTVTLQRLPRLIGLARALDLMITGLTHRRRTGPVLRSDQRNHPTRPASHPALGTRRHIAAYPQPGLLTTRRAALEALDLPLADGLALEVALAADPLTDANKTVTRLRAATTQSH